MRSSLLIRTLGSFFSFLGKYPRRRDTYGSVLSRVFGAAKLCDTTSSMWSLLGGDLLLTFSHRLLLATLLPIPRLISSSRIRSRFYSIPMIKSMAFWGWIIIALQFTSTRPSAGLPSYSEILVKVWCPTSWQTKLSFVDVTRFSNPNSLSTMSALAP